MIYIYIYNGVYQWTFNLGSSPCMVLQGHFCFGMGRSLSLLANNCQDQLCPPLLEENIEPVIRSGHVATQSDHNKKRTSHLPTIYIYTYRVLTYIYIYIYIYISILVVPCSSWTNPQKNTPCSTDSPTLHPYHLRIPILSPSSQVEMKKKSDSPSWKNTSQSRCIYIYNYI